MCHLKTPWCLVTVDNIDAAPVALGLKESFFIMAKIEMAKNVHLQMGKLFSTRFANETNFAV